MALNLQNTILKISAGTPKQIPGDSKVQVAFSGRSNVGKSSFINALAGMKKLARTSDTPGRTRLVNYFDFGEFILADLPGYGYAKVSKAEKDKWADTMEKFFADKTACDYVLSLVDIRHDPTADDITMINFLHSSAIAFTVIATKTDKVSRMQVKQRLKSIANRFALTENDVYGISSETKAGKDEILSKLDSVTAVIKGNK